MISADMFESALDQCFFSLLINDKGLVKSGFNSVVNGITMLSL